MPNLHYLNFAVIVESIIKLAIIFVIKLMKVEFEKELIVEVMSRFKKYTFA